MDRNVALADGMFPLSENHQAMWIGYPLGAASLLVSRTAE
jgi:hypothetical protein